MAKRSSQANTPMAVLTTGDRRASLEALRGYLAAAIEVAVPREVAALSRELRDVMAELDKLPDGREVSGVDDLAARRTARRKAAAGVPVPEVGDQRGT